MGRRYSHPQLTKGSGEYRELLHWGLKTNLVHYVDSRKPMITMIFQILMYNFKQKLQSIVKKLTQSDTFTLPSVL